jgi:hypothetical protein
MIYLFIYLFSLLKNRNLVIYAWNPNNNILTYHAGNKGSMQLDFFANTKINEMRLKRRKNLLSHGIAMFLVYA